MLTSQVFTTVMLPHIFFTYPETAGVSLAKPPPGCRVLSEDGNRRLTFVCFQRTLEEIDTMFDDNIAAWKTKKAPHRLQNRANELMDERKGGVAVHAEDNDGRV